MSAEDLEVHQPADTPGQKQCLTLKGSQGDGAHGFLQRAKGNRGGSLPSLVDVSSQPNEEEEVDVPFEGDVSANNFTEQEMTLIRVAVENNQ